MVILIAASVALLALIVAWRRMRKGRQARAAVVTSAPVVQALNGNPVTRRAPGRLRGSQGRM